MTNPWHLIHCGGCHGWVAPENIETRAGVGIVALFGLCPFCHAIMSIKLKDYVMRGESEKDSN